MNLTSEPPATAAGRPVAKRFRDGTHRTMSPAATLERIRPHLSAAGITRCADITGLDRLGIPTCAAIRPRGHTLQVANGKGLTMDAARASALMEAIEFHHAEQPIRNRRKTSLRQLKNDGHRVLPPTWFAHDCQPTYFSRDFVLPWTEGRDLFSGEPVWMPASAASYAIVPRVVGFHTNGLASGNHPLEAMLHALYELLERDALARLFEGGRLDRNRARFVNLDTIDDPGICLAVEQIRRADCGLVLFRMQGVEPTNAFGAAILDPNPFARISRVNLGFGAHLSPAVAACRAITEAAQARLTFIHGTREDMVGKIRYGDHERTENAYSFFSGIAANAAWTNIADHSTADFARDCSRVLNGLHAAGHHEAAQIDLTRDDFGIPVVKVYVRGLQIDWRTMGHG